MKKLLWAILVLALTACTTTSPDVVQRRDTQRLSTVQDAIVQARGTDQLLPGEPVILVTTGGKVRVTRAPR